jgi:hypothetical protein
MWVTPSSTARRSTAIAASRLRGAGSHGILVRRIAPKPMRLIVWSPSCQVPAASAVWVVVRVVMGRSLVGGWSDGE